MVTSYIQLLERRYASVLDEVAQEYIAFTVDGVERMRQLITDLLQYSRIGVNRSPAPVDLEDVFADVLANLGTAIAESGARIAHSPLPVVMADATQMGQLLQNLLGNAIKYRRQQDQEIELGAEDRGDSWRLWVQDHGIGIASRHLERIFVAFQRLHSRDQYEGTGMGLAICKRIVEAHGGRIWAESEPGSGSAFYFTLPKAGAEPAPERGRG